MVKTRTVTVHQPVESDPPGPAVPAPTVTKVSTAVAPAGDPTGVMGWRIAAWVVDVALFTLLMAFLGPTALSPFAEYYETSQLAEDDCGYVQDINDDATSCLDVGDRIYITDTTETIMQAVVGLAWIVVVMGVAQGRWGVTPGKALVGLEVVDERGEPPGFRRALVRTALWAVDGAPWVLPLVGAATGLTTTGHRRVGDMVARTFVVDKRHTGPVAVPGPPATEHGDTGEQAGADLAGQHPAHPEHAGEEHAGGQSAHPERVRQASQTDG